MKHSNTAVIVSAVGLVTLVAIPQAIIHFTTQEQVVAQVTAKERVSTKETSKYLIFTEQETFENTDSLVAFKWNSSDIYGRIKVGSDCTFTVTGFRIPFLSMYRNIIQSDCK